MRYGEDGKKAILTTKKLKSLQTKTFYGKEKKSLAYVIAIMNMILHGIDTPNIIHTNTLADNLADVQEKDRYDDSAWPQGAAQLGYGDGDERTVVDYGGDSSNKYITTYFRNTFSVSNPSAYPALIVQ